MNHTETHQTSPRSFWLTLIVIAFMVITFFLSPTSLGNWASWLTAWIQGWFPGHHTAELCPQSFWLLGRVDCDFQTALTRGELNLVMERLWWTLMFLMLLWNAAERYVEHRWHPAPAAATGTTKAEVEGMIRTAITAIPTPTPTPVGISSAELRAELTKVTQLIDTKIAAIPQPTPAPVGVTKAELDAWVTALRSELNRSTNRLTSADQWLEEELNRLTSELSQAKAAGHTTRERVIIAEMRDLLTAGQVTNVHPVAHEHHSIGGVHPKYLVYTLLAVTIPAMIVAVVVAMR
jgi:hypothetical protein